MMNLKNCGIKDFFTRCNNRRLYTYGLSKDLKTRMTLRTPDYDVRDITYQFVDNNAQKWNTKYCWDGKEKLIISPIELCKNIRVGDIILIASVLHYGEILEQLDANESLKGIDCYILVFIDDAADSKLDQTAYINARSNSYCIPPIIHYCWFGNKKIPDQYLEYIETWKRMCPSYEIIKWNEDNYDVKKHPYMKWAYEKEKWAFVSDYARLDIIYSYGGIYLDTDVELLRNLDELRKFHAYVGYESTQIVATGLGFGAEKENIVIQMMKDVYDEALCDESYLFPCTVHQTNILRTLGLKGDNSFQILADNQIVVLPTEFLCGIRLNTREQQITKKTYSLHHYSGDWGGSDKVFFMDDMRQKYCKTIIDRIREGENSGKRSI